MQERIEEELTLLRKRYPDLEYREEGRWIRIPAYPLPSGWNRASTDVAFQIPVGYPGTQPYGFCTPAGLLFNGQSPENCQGADPMPPFEGGPWVRFSWTPETAWQPAAQVTAGSNLLNWVIGFADRFRQGK